MRPMLPSLPMLLQLLSFLLFFSSTSSFQLAATLSKNHHGVVRNSRCINGRKIMSSTGIGITTTSTGLSAVSSSNGDDRPPPRRTLTKVCMCKCGLMILFFEVYVFIKYCLSTLFMCSYIAAEEQTHPKDKSTHHPRWSASRRRSQSRRGGIRY